MSTRPDVNNLVERLDVAGEPGDDAAGGSAREPCDLEALEVREQRVAQVAHDELAGHQHGARLQGEQHGGGNQGCQVERRERREACTAGARQVKRLDEAAAPAARAVPVSRPEVQIDGGRRDERPRDLEDGAAEYQHRGQNDATAVGERPA